MRACCGILRRPSAGGWRSLLGGISYICCQRWVSVVKQLKIVVICAVSNTNFIWGSMRVFAVRGTRAEFVDAFHSEVHLNTRDGYD